MSDVGAAIPDNVNLAKSKPLAVKSFSRRVKSVATNNQQFTENQYMRIVVDTAVPGASLDPLQSYLKFDISFTNTNPFIDFLNFGVCGVSSVIEEFRVYQQGTPLEEIINYNSVVEAYMDLGGIGIEPKYMFRSNKLKQNVDQKFSINAIKPPMVSNDGNPMYFQATFSNIYNQSSFWASGTNGSFANNNYKPFLLGTQAVGMSFHRIQVFTGANSSGAAIAGNTLQESGMDPCDPFQYSVDGSASAVALQVGGQTLNDAGTFVPVAAPAAQSAAFSQLQTQVYGGVGVETGTFNQQTLIPRGRNKFRRPVPIDIPAFLLGRSNVVNNLPAGIGAFYSVPSGTIASGTLPTYSAGNANTTNCIDSNYFPISSTYDRTDGQLSFVNGQSPAASLFGSAIYFMTNSDYDPQNPLNWPFIMPHDNYKSMNNPSVQLQEYFNMLCNVKRIPIGLIGNARGSANDKANYVGGASSTTTSNLNFQNVSQLSSTSSQTLKTTCCVNLMSGIFGALATKAFPTMLLSPGSLNIEIKTAQATKALQVSMDPCRRVLGTVRDYIPFGGSIGGVYGQFNYVNPFNSQSLGSQYVDNTVSTKTTGDMLLSNMTRMKYYGLATASSSVLNTNVAPTIAQTPWMSNGYFGVPSGMVFNAPCTYNGLDIANIGPSVVDFFVTKRPMPMGCFACIGPNLAPLQVLLATPSVNAISGNGVGLSLNVDLIYSPYSVAAMEGKWTTYEIIDETSQLQGCFTQSFSSNTNTKTDNVVYQSRDGLAAYQVPLGTAPAIPNIPQAIANLTDTRIITSSSTSGTSFASPQDCVGGINMYTNTNTHFPAFGPNQLNTNIILGCAIPIPTFGVAQQNTLTLDDTICTQYVGEVADVSYINIQDAIGGPTVGFQPTGANLRGARYSTIKSSSNRPILQSNIPTAQKFNVNQIGFVESINTNNAVFTPNCSQEMTLCGHPSGVPIPQYILVSTPWNKKSLYMNLSTYEVYGDIVGFSDLCSETTACYGTYLEESVDQSLRCFNSGNTSYVSYTISNVEFISTQIILPETVTDKIINQAASSDISINTNFIRCYQSSLNSSTSQNIIIPAKISSANSMLICFQPQNYLNNTEAQLYNSMSRFCPFSQISTLDAYPQTTAVSNAGKPTSLYAYNATPTQPYGVGQSTPFSVVNCPSSSGSFQIQLLLGNELLPQQPITSVTEIVSELLKTQHKLFDTSSNINAQFSLIPNAGFSSSASFNFSNATVSNFGDTVLATQYYYDSQENNGFCTAFTFPGFMDDQTYISNPNMNYVAACAWNNTVTATNPANVAAADLGLGGGMSGTGTSHGIQDLFGARGPYCLRTFLPLESKFMIGLDLDTWSRISDVARSGRFLGNNTIQLQINNAIALNTQSAVTGCLGVNMLTMIQFDARLSFQAGGGVVSYY